jgi:serine/threonine-protein kinase
MTANRVITHCRVLLRRHVRVLVLGIGAAVAFLLPPFHVAARLDGALFDLWSGLRPAPSSADIVLVPVADPVWLTALAELTDREQGRLIVTTLPQPPSAGVNTAALGPTEIPIGDLLIRRTEWANGGHIRFGRDDDGLVRALPAWLDGDRSLPSLALSAAQQLGYTDAAEPAQSRLPLAGASGYRRLTAAELTIDPTLVTGMIVVAGRPDFLYETPAGPLPAFEIVARAIDAYRHDALIGSTPIAAVLPWLLAALTLLAMFVEPRPGRPGRVALLAAGTASLVGANALAYFAALLWIPVAAPAALLVTSGVLLIGRPSQPRTAPVARRSDAESILAELAHGNAALAWQQICDLPADQSTLDDLCDFAAALEAAGYLELAADVCHRAAQVNPRHRDIARRLIRVSQTAEERAAAEAGFADMAVPRTLGRYEILEPIGRGSTGMVHLAVDPTINRLVALKVFNLRAEYGDDALDEGLERFHREASSAGRLKHPNIVTIFDIGQSQGLAFIAMEFLKGRHLSHFTTPETLLPPGLVLDIGATIADALDYAHSRNVIHRDIKPGNIMYDSVAGAATITDFGIARLIDVSRTRTGIVLGTPSFMAPEQLEGNNVNRHTDLFALGVTIYELLTGRLPFLGASMTKLMFVITNEPHPPVTALRPELPASMDLLFDRALAKCPEDRFANGAEMAAALRRSAGQIV